MSTRGGPANEQTPDADWNVLALIDRHENDRFAYRTAEELAALVQPTGSTYESDNL